MIGEKFTSKNSSIIKVIGVGGGGSNAISKLFTQGIEGIDFYVCNTDEKALKQSPIPNKIQLGSKLTKGLGTGAKPVIGQQACEESLEKIKSIFTLDTKLVIIAAGMGGGTGTGACPVICAVCKEMGILTICIVTTPASYEGAKRKRQAEAGVLALEKEVNTLIVIDNNKLKLKFRNIKIEELFAKSDSILGIAVKCITDVINSTGQINVDFANVCTVIKNGGHGILCYGSATGNNRAEEAIQSAFALPLAAYTKVANAKWVLANICSAEGPSEFTMDEVDIVQNYLLSKTGLHTDVILGLGYDNTLDEKLGVTLIIIGFNYNSKFNHESNQPIQSDEPGIIQEFDQPSSDKPINPVPLKKKSRLPSGLPKRITQAILMPAFILIMQSFFKLLFDIQNIGFGVSLASVSLAQLFPYLFYDNLILLKVYKLNAAFDENEGSLVTKHYFSIEKNSKQIARLKTWTLILFIIVLSLFIITLGLAYKQQLYDYHTITGIFCVLLSILYLIFV